MLLDTECLICATGQRGAAKQGRALAFLSAHTTSDFFTSRVCWSEFAEGMEQRGEVDPKLRRYAILEVDEPIAWRASRVARALTGTGLHIGDNDIWLAATALEFGLPLVSNNKKHFARVPGLDLRAY